MKPTMALPAVCAALCLQACAPSLPAYTEPDRVVWLDQNWSDKERFWFHHATQGTATFPIPYLWFVSLEQPTIWFGDEPPRFRDPAYLARFGFIPSSKGSEGAYGRSSGRTYGTNVIYDEANFYGNEHELPVGFARTNLGDERRDLIGLTCAGCHTGQFEYQGTSVRIDGGPAVTDLGKFREAMVMALIYTKWVPGRFDRFAANVLGEGHTEEDAEVLRKQLNDGIARILRVKDMIDQHGPDRTKEGFARLDALNRIGNQVFTLDFLDEDGVPLDFDPWDNHAAINAPVNFPHIWSTPWFDWVQYDASIMQPMVRNAGEALGVSAKINLTRPKNGGPPLFSSTLQLGEIRKMELLIAGENPFLRPDGTAEPQPHFKGLRAPKWPEDLLGSIDPGKAAQGKVLYLQYCSGCHGPPVNDPSGAFWRDEKRWTPPNEANERYYKVTVKKQPDIGTDPAQGDILARRMVRFPCFLELTPEDEACHQTEPGPQAPSTELDFGSALAKLVEKANNAWYDAAEIPDEERIQWNGNRPNRIQAGAGYKARPLNGIWATAPYLHNGSVPNLYTLLQPVEERPKAFCLGHREYDPEHVGYQLIGSKEGESCPPGTFHLDTTQPGNSNAGHEFRYAEQYGDGIVGKLRFSDEERRAIIEFLKTL